MSTFVHSFSTRTVLCVDHRQFKRFKDLKTHLCETKGFPEDSCFFVCNGALVDDDDCVKENVVYHTYLRILGGKGGFGSMLRAIGAQIEKTTNHEACRDLSGRRMRDVNNEKDLKDWLGKQTEREKEREQRREERTARRRAMPRHKFEDPLYDQQRALLAENQDDAIQTGLKKSQPAAGSSTSMDNKRKSDTDIPGSKAKKNKGTEWLGVDLDDMSDSDDDSNQGDSNQGDSNQGDSNQGSSTSQQSHDPDTTNSSVITEPIGSSFNDREQTDSQLHRHSDSVLVKTTQENSNKEDKQLDTLPVKEEEFILNEVSSLEEVIALGLDRLKSELMSRGLKCGGTLQQRADRLFSVKGLTPDQIDPSLFSKSTNEKHIKGKK